MPVQKGKKRKRERRRSMGEFGVVAEPIAPAQPARQSRTREKRKGWTPPFWVNAVFGVAMLVFGVLFTLLPQRGVSSQNKVLLLIAYCVIAGFYLARAYRQYRSKRPTG